MISATGRVAAFLLAGTVLAGCGGGQANVREIIGVDKNPPDPFSTVPTAPLQMPRDLATLPPPNPGAPSLVEPTPLKDAQIALLGQEVQTTAAQSQGEMALVAATSRSVDPDIRAVVDAEYAAKNEGEYEYILDRILPALRELRGDYGDTVDPIGELVALGRITPEEAAAIKAAIRSGGITITGL